MQTQLHKAVNSQGEASALGFPPLGGGGAAYPYQFFFYSAFGENLVSQHANTGNFATPYKFNAKEQDPEPSAASSRTPLKYNLSSEQTGNYYYGARYYNPQTSIWFGVDPLAILSPDLNPYHFVRNNPIYFIDPNGLTEYENAATGEKKSVNDGNNSCDVVCVSPENWNSVLKHAESFEEGGGAQVKSLDQIIINGNVQQWQNIESGRKNYGTFSVNVSKQQLSHLETIRMLDDGYNSHNSASDVYGILAKSASVKMIADFIKRNPMGAVLTTTLELKSEYEGVTASSYQKALALYAEHGSNSGLWIVTEVFQTTHYDYTNITINSTFYKPNGKEFFKITWTN